MVKIFRLQQHAFQENHRNNKYSDGGISFFVLSIPMYHFRVMNRIQYTILMKWEKADILQTFHNFAAFSFLIMCKTFLTKGSFEICLLIFIIAMLQYYYCPVNIIIVMITSGCQRSLSIGFSLYEATPPPFFISI